MIIINYKKGNYFFKQTSCFRKKDRKYFYVTQVSYINLSANNVIN